MLVPILCVIIAILSIALIITTIGWISCARALSNSKRQLFWHRM